MKPLVYHYSDARHFLVDAYKAKQVKNPRYSLRTLAKSMGFKCHSSLVLLYQGKRKILPEHVDRIAQGLRVSEEESRYLRALVQLASAKSEKDREFYLAQLKDLYPAEDFSVVEVEKFRLISDWVHMAILEMTKLADFQSDLDWLESRLWFKIDRPLLERAVKRLIQLGLLKVEAGEWKKTSERLTTPKDYASESIREHHRQVLTNAIAALDEQSVEERMFNSCAMTINASKMNDAKALIRKFREDMAKLMEKSAGDETYQLTVGFFRLTKSPVRKDLQ